MSGHSKWSTIKRDKGANDVKRAQVFTRLARAITVAAKKGGGKPEANSNLRKAIEEARALNLPKDKIERAIIKGTGGGSEAPLEELILEGYGPSGVAFLIHLVTDNRNRTLSEMRNIFTRFQGNLGQPGSAAYVFGQDPENPSFTIAVDNPQEAKKVLNLAQTLEDQNDVQKVYANFNIPDEVLTGLTLG